MRKAKRATRSISVRRTLISQDSGWYRVGEPGGGHYRGYTFLYTNFPPMPPREILGMLPRASFAIPGSVW
jgi:hypothetical protein